VGGLVEKILSVDALLVYVIVGLLVFAEDALFVGFVLPGETAAILGGVDASRGHVSLVAIAALVALAAIIGDSVGYEIGRVLGPRILRARPLRRHSERLRQAQDLLARRGGVAVFLGRFVAVFRAIMPALAGASRMRYPRFLAYNAVGGFVWGVGAVLTGYLAGNSFKAVERTAGRSAAVIVAMLAIVALLIWRLRRRHRERPD
jgi:membrane protein DedA with SNARE-associated domain